MDKTYDHTKVEDKIYKRWEDSGTFQPEINPDGKPYCIVLPPPNANGALHFGHAMFTVEDILIRYHRMKGYAALWLPGSDHAGIETQFVFEKKLAQEGKSRFDFPRETLYGMIRTYVDENRGGIQNQLRKLGYSLDWTREKYTLDPSIVDLVVETFKKMYADGLVYRDYRLVNYCTKDGTSFSDLETVSEEKEGILYHIQFPIKTGGFITIATTRPETLVGDVAVMVNPKDKRYEEFVGKTVLLPVVDREIPIIADEYVDMEFGTGAVKVTPAHDFNDFEIARKHELTFPPIIGWDGKMQHAGPLNGLYVKQAREKILEILKEKNLVEKEEKHQMVMKICYKCKTILEPLPLEQWYVKVDTLRKQAIDVVKQGKLKIVPKSFEHPYFQWLEGLRDWNISRQNVWGIRVPVWYEVENEADFAVTFLDKKGEYHQGLLTEILGQGFSFEEILEGLQRVIARMEAKVVFEEQKQKDKRYLPETDTFDTWFSSGQWPIVTLKTARPGDFEKFYPTAVLETAYDILRSWVSRMVMLGVYMTGEIPFHDALFHGIVNDPYGKKMSKSKGNVVNPLELVDQYGADAVRFALVYGNATGSDQSLAYPKLDAARKFTNKLWNMARFIEFKMQQDTSLTLQWGSLDEIKTQSEEDKKMIEKTQKLTVEISHYLDKYQFNLAAERLYDFAWHEFADIYIEDVKNRTNQNSFDVLVSVYITILKLLHPIMPFVTEEIFDTLTHDAKPLIIQSWPTA
ncbi:MAG TPA: valine--tRNA ligase [Patescibacteria group bacterium]|nr:valine--tRNA ligase [Patescibacteria group bacterium]